VAAGRAKRNIQQAGGDGTVILNMSTILIVILVLLLLGVFPAWPHSRKWGYGPTGGVGLIVIILLVLLLTGRL
jgi:hypothetical protein